MIDKIVHLHVEALGLDVTMKKLTEQINQHLMPHHASVNILKWESWVDYRYDTHISAIVVYNLKSQTPTPGYY